MNSCQFNQNNADNNKLNLLLTKAKIDKLETVLTWDQEGCSLTAQENIFVAVNRKDKTNQPYIIRHKGAAVEKPDQDDFEAEFAELEPNKRIYITISVDNLKYFIFDAPSSKLKMKIDID